MISLDIAKLEINNSSFTSRPINVRTPNAHFQLILDAAAGEEGGGIIERKFFD
jgi:hypothetical protein